MIWCIEIVETLAVMASILIPTSISWLRSWILCCTARNSTWKYSIIPRTTYRQTELFRDTAQSSDDERKFDFHPVCVLCACSVDQQKLNIHQKLLHPVRLLGELRPHDVRLNGLVHLWCNIWIWRNERGEDVTVFFFFAVGAIYCMITTWLRAARFCWSCMRGSRASSPAI